MARTSRPESIYKVSVHRNGGHNYAATHPFTVGDDGRRHYRILHWGTVTEDLRFIPGKRFLEAPDEIKERLVFPEEWDVSDIKGSSRMHHVAIRTFPFLDGDGDRSFGDIWLLERIVGRFGLREDLAEAFGNAADDLLTLAYYPFLTGMSFLRFARWQATTKVPSMKPLVAMVSDSLTPVNKVSFRKFMDLRRSRYSSGNLCAVDSVIRHSSGDSVSDRKWGQKAERIHFQSTVEAVAYSLDDHVPVIYSSYPEVVADARGIGIFRTGLGKIGLSGITVITDRGYESLQGLERFYQDGPMVMCVDVKQPAVMERIEAFGRFRSNPAGMRYDAASRRWYRQYPLAPGLRLNLFFNPERRAAELAQIDAEITSQQEALKEIADYGIAITDRKTLRRDYYFFNAIYDAGSQTVRSFAPDKSRILNTRAASGFYANITSRLDIGPLEAVSIYGLKYDQERFLRQFRSLLDFPQGPSTGGLSFGVQVLQYIGLLLNTWLRHALQSGVPEDIPCHSVMELLDEMHSVPCADAGDGTCIPAPLYDTHLRILSALNLI